MSGEAALRLRTFETVLRPPRRSVSSRRYYRYTHRTH